MKVTSRIYRREVRAMKERDGVRRVSLQDGALTIGRIRFHDDGTPIVDLVTCGSCGRTWNDALITGVTPAPSARCPFEYQHREVAR